MPDDLVTLFGDTHCSVCLAFEFLLGITIVVVTLTMTEILGVDCLFLVDDTLISLIPT